MYGVRCKVHNLWCMMRDVGCLMYCVYGVRSVMDDVGRNMYDLWHVALMYVVCSMLYAV